MVEAASTMKEKELVKFSEAAQARVQLTVVMEVTVDLRQMMPTPMKCAPRHILNHTTMVRRPDTKAQEEPVETSTEPQEDQAEELSG